MENNINEIVRLARLSLIRDIQIAMLQKEHSGLIISREIVDEILNELEIN
jgi:hypothetical protein